MPFHNARPDWCVEASLALLLINLKDVLAALNRLGHRITFQDDIDGGDDITDLVANMRNAICHNGSPLRMLDAQSENIVSFCRIEGQGTLMKINDIELGNPYQDDVAFFYGRHRILLVRHINRVIREAEREFQCVAQMFGYRISH